MEKITVSERGFSGWFATFEISRNVFSKETELGSPGKKPVKGAGLPECGGQTSPALPSFLPRTEMRPGRGLGSPGG